MHCWCRQWKEQQTHRHTDGTATLRKQSKGPLMDTQQAHRQAQQPNKKQFVSMNALLVPPMEGATDTQTHRRDSNTEEAIEGTSDGCTAGLQTGSAAEQETVRIDECTVGAANGRSNRHTDTQTGQQH